MTEAKVARKAEEIFFKYVDARKLEYFEIIAFLVSKKSTFNVQAQSSHKMIMKKLKLLQQMSADIG